MKLIKPSFEIITPINGEEILKQIELAARTCYQSEGKIEYGKNSIEGAGILEQIKDTFYASSARTLIPKLINKGHHAMLEFGGMITVRFICDRGISHELVRHRLCSFAQESTRYCNYGKDEHIQFIIPCWCKELNKCETYDPLHIVDLNESNWYHTMLMLEDNYNLMINNGWTPQQARSVLPNSLKTEINMSANLREWREIFKQRTNKAAHIQMRELMIPLLTEFKQRIPIVFDDIIVKE